jgi:alpha-glucoside transport system substrate-binding protein
VGGVGCTPPGPPAPTTAPTSSSRAALAGDHVDVSGLWSGPELDAFTTVAHLWEDGTGGVVDCDGSQNPARDVKARRASTRSSGS